MVAAGGGEIAGKLGGEHRPVSGSEWIVLDTKTGPAGGGPIGGSSAETMPSRRLVPKWITVFFVGCAVVLVPWTVIIFDSLRNRALAEHWRLVWGGFDCFLVLAFALTAYRIITRSPRGAIAATATGTMLLIDAWFDVLTARGTQNFLTSVTMAVFAEIPCSIICFFVARRIVSLFEQAVPYLHTAGFRIAAGRLVPPSNALWAAPESIDLLPGAGQDGLTGAPDAAANGTVDAAADSARDNSRAG
jgi:hypothetical protein